MNLKGVQKLWNVVNVSVWKKPEGAAPWKFIFMVLGDWGVHQQAENAFCTYKCTACQLAIFYVARVEF